MNVTLRQMKAFTAVARHPSFTAAGRPQPLPGRRRHGLDAAPRRAAPRRAGSPS